MVDGVISVWKDAGMTSHDVVSKIRKLFGQKRVGHAGTLDPAVTGVLLVCLGQATRLVERLQSQSKTYRGQVLFGISTDTEDMSGEILSKVPVESVISTVTEPAFRELLPRMTGEITQVPPMVSALKVNGKRLYEYAREGQVIERKGRNVYIHRLELLKWGQNIDGYPIGDFEVECSKGTYVRTLCTDFGAAFNVPSVMSELVRTQYGRFGRSESYTLEELNGLKESGHLMNSLIPISIALQGWTFAHLNDPQREKWVSNGGSLQTNEWHETISGVYNTDREFVLLLPDGRVAGIYAWNEERQLWKPDVIFTIDLNES